MYLWLLVLGATLALISVHLDEIYDWFIKKLK